VSDVSAGGGIMQSRQALVQHPAADSTRSFVTHSPFTIERTTRFGMALKGDRLWFVYKPRALVWPPSAASPSPLEIISYNLKTDAWSQPLALGEPFKASVKSPRSSARPPWTSPISWRMGQFIIS
jgi:hypothetical protein